MTGNVRENNEDSVYVHPDGNYFLVADGMGGQAAGEKASSLAVEIIQKGFDEEVQFDLKLIDNLKDVVEKVIANANYEIMSLGEMDPQYHQMGTTVVLVLHVADKLILAHVGDSRCYRYHDEKLELMTTDHSLVQALIEAGTVTPAEAETHRYRNVLYKYLGSKEGGSGADTEFVNLQVGDRFLLCSDGVNDGLNDAEIETVLKSCEDPQETVDLLIQAALDGGSRDNISAVIIDAVE